jgi:hypothetical protein
MKRTIKLTESDLIKIVKRLIKEEKLSKSNVLKKHVLKYGWEDVAERIGGFDVLYKHAFNNDYNGFLNLYNNLDLVNIKDEDDIFKYVDEGGNIILVYDEFTEIVHVSHNLIWSFFSYNGLKFHYVKVENILMEWIKTNYNIDNVSTVLTDNFNNVEWSWLRN